MLACVRACVYVCVRARAGLNVCLRVRACVHACVRAIVRVCLFICHIGFFSVPNFSSFNTHFKNSFLASSTETKPDENYSIRYNCRMVSPLAPPPTPMSLPDLSPQPTPLTEPIVRDPLICLYNPANRQPIRYVNQSSPPPGYVPVYVSTGEVYPPIFALEPRDSAETTVVWNTVPGRRVMVQSGTYSPLLERPLSIPRRRRSSVAYIPTSQIRCVTAAAK